MTDSSHHQTLADYVQRVANDLRHRVLYGSGQMLHVDIEQRWQLSLSKRLKEARKQPYAVFLVVGEKEMQRGTVSVRSNSHSPRTDHIDRREHTEQNREHTREEHREHREKQQETDLESLAAEFNQWMKDYY